jgi:hypothetical protein
MPLDPIFDAWAGACSIADLLTIAVIVMMTLRVNRRAEAGA